MSVEMFVELEPAAWERIPDPEGDCMDQLLASMEERAEEDGDLTRLDLRSPLRLLRLVDGLPMFERQVLRWRYGLEGMSLSYREIAKRVGTSHSNVVKCEQRALNYLRALYGLEQQAAASQRRLTAA
jgi:DNA-directed RNA polymerase specialized sigma subunit